jgi:hypothetical protein
MNTSAMQLKQKGGGTRTPAPPPRPAPPDGAAAKGLTISTTPQQHAEETSFPAGQNRCGRCRCHRQRGRTFDVVLPGTAGCGK